VTSRPRYRGFDRTAIVVLGAVIAAGAAGVGAGLLATDEDPPRVAPQPRPVIVRTDALSLQLPTGWSQLERVPRLAGLTGPGTVAVRGESADVVITSRRLEGPSLLPRAFLASLTNPLPEPSRVLVGEHRAYLYGGLFGLRRDARVDILALPTTRGMATVACIADAATGPSSADCVTALERLELNDATAVDAEPGVAVALTLRRTVMRLEATRLRTRRLLAASRVPATRRGAAERLARAHDVAAGQLAVMADTATDRATVGNLRALARAYRAYAAASARRNVRAARAAGGRIRVRERELTRRLAARTAFRLDAT